MFRFKSINVDFDWAILPLRLVVGFGFVAHGYAKLSRGPENFGVILASLGVPQPHIVAWVTALIEFLGGGCLMIGLFVFPLSIPLILIMYTAIISVHAPLGFSSVRLKAVTTAGPEFGPVGYEINLLYIAALLALGLGSAGKLSVDNFLKERKRSRK